MEDTRGDKGSTKRTSASSSPRFARPHSHTDRCARRRPSTGNTKEVKALPDLVGKTFQAYLVSRMYDFHVSKINAYAVELKKTLGLGKESSLSLTPIMYVFGAHCARFHCLLTPRSVSDPLRSA